jgi:hypothetical protein
LRYPLLAAVHSHEEIDEETPWMKTSTASKKKMQLPDTARIFFCIYFFAIQQKSLFNARITSKIPIMVNAIFDQETFNQANTITRTARINLHRQKVIFSSLC